MTRLLVIADTHVRRGGQRSGKRTIPDKVFDEARCADRIWHAGDVLVPEFLDELGRYAPVTAVLGNNDTELAGVLPQRWQETIDGVTLAMVHEPGPTKGRSARLRRWFPNADVVIFGHTHQPLLEVTDEGYIAFNPGSPTEKRRSPGHSIGRIDVVDGRCTPLLLPLS